MSSSSFSCAHEHLSSDANELDPLLILTEKVKHLQDQIRSTRYLNPRTPILHNSQMHLLWWYKEHSPIRFRRKVQVAPDTFDRILSLICDHPVFIGDSVRNKIPVDIQLAIFLNRIGHYGNASSVDDIAEWAGVSVGTVVNVTKRCLLTIINLHDQALSSPTADEIQGSKNWCELKVIPEWRDGWLAVDGTTLPLFQKPGLHGEAWFDKSSQYSMNAQFIILLHNLRIVDYSLGHTGSAHDSYAFQSTRFATAHDEFLTSEEWIWADSAYPIRRWCITPFRKPRNGELSREQKRFNYRLSTVRVRAEHAIGLLKGRFQSLRELRIQIGTHELHRFAILWVRCCIILHNLIIQYEDESLASDVEWRNQCVHAGLHGGDDSEHFDDEDEEHCDSDHDAGVTDEGDGHVPQVAREGSLFRDELLHVLLFSPLYMST